MKRFLIILGIIIFSLRAVTANAFEYYKKQAEDYGMNGYVTKPLIKEKLYEEISRVTTRQ